MLRWLKMRRARSWLLRRRRRRLVGIEFDWEEFFDYR
jgi:hypothetical protein